MGFIALLRTNKNEAQNRDRDCRLTSFGPRGLELVLLPVLRFGLPQGANRRDSLAGYIWLVFSLPAPHCPGGLPEDCLMSTDIQVRPQPNSRWFGFTSISRPRQEIPRRECFHLVDCAPLEMGRHRHLIIGSHVHSQ